MKLPADIVFKEQPDYLMAFKGQNSVLIEGDRIPNRQGAQALSSVSVLLCAVRSDGPNLRIRALKQFGSGPQIPFPTPTPPRQITGTIRYVDPTWGGPFVGTFAQPFANPTAAMAASVSGDAVLFKEGTTLPPTGATITPAVGGVIIGVYEAQFGNWVSTKTGAATIDCGGAAFDTISAVNKNNVTVIGLRFINPPPGAWCINISGTSSGAQILRNSCTGGPFHFAVQSSGTGHNIEFNESINATNFGVYYQLGSNDSTTTVNFNRVTGSLENMLFVTDASDGRTFSGSILANYLTDGGIASGSAALLKVWTLGGAAKIGYNYGTRGRRGLWLECTQLTSPGDFTGTIIESNDFSFAEFPLVVTGCTNVLVQYNSFTYAGTLDGVTPISASKFSRNMEFWGLNATRAVRNAVVRWNYVGFATYLFRTLAEFPGSEAIGIGFDDNCQNCIGYGNFSERNGGHGFQANSGHGNQFYGNWSIDDCAAADVGNWPEDHKCSIFHILNPGILIANNTIVQTGRPGQVFGVSEGSSFPSSGGSVINNVVIGSRRAAIARALSGGSVESSNLAIRCGGLVANSANGNPLTAAISTIFGGSNDIDETDAFYPPIAGRGADNTGAAVQPGMLSGSGRPLVFRTPRGALHPVAA